MDERDRELLVLAARALNDQKIQFNGAIWVNAGRMSAADARGDRYPSEWNPLSDDGDALRLAVRLGISIERATFHPTEVHAHPALTHASVVTHFERLDPDPYAATRRAIVRAAAEIGRAK